MAHKRILKSSLSIYLNLSKSKPTFLNRGWGSPVSRLLRQVVGYCGSILPRLHTGKKYTVINKKHNRNTKNLPWTYMSMQKDENCVGPLYNSVAYVYQAAIRMVGFSVSSECVLNEYEWNDYHKRRKCVFTWNVFLYEILQNMHRRIWRSVTR